MAGSVASTITKGTEDLELEHLHYLPAANGSLNKLDTQLLVAVILDLRDKR